MDRMRVQCRHKHSTCRGRWVIFGDFFLFDSQISGFCFISSIRCHTKISQTVLLVFRLFFSSYSLIYVFAIRLPRSCPPSLRSVPRFPPHLRIISNSFFLSPGPYWKRIFIGIAFLVNDLVVAREAGPLIISILIIDLVIKFNGAKSINCHSNDVLGMRSK